MKRCIFNLYVKTKLFVNRKSLKVTMFTQNEIPSISSNNNSASFIMSGQGVAGKGSYTRAYCT